jgi:hypothetical protein
MIFALSAAHFEAQTTRLTIVESAAVHMAVNFARAANLHLIIKNTGNCYLGKSSGAGAPSLWVHNMKDIDFMPVYESPGYLAQHSSLLQA